MPILEPPTQITLKVKVPPGYLPPSTSTTDSEQFNIGLIPVTTTVGALRAQIQQLVPTHPPPERQRILYGGRALVDNEQTVGDALNTKRDPTQDEYVVHLLVRGEGGDSRAPTPGSMASGTHTRPGSVPAASIRDGQPTPLNTTSHTPQTAEQHPNLARHAELQQQIWRQHMQAHQHALPGQGFPMFGPQHLGLANGMLGTAASAGPQGTPIHLNQGADRDGAPHDQQHPPNQNMGQGFHVEGVGPDGQHFQIHQQTVNIPAMGVPGGMPGQNMMPGPFNSLGMGVPGRFGRAQGPARPANVPTALDQARENLVELRRMLDEISARAEGGNDPQEQERLRDMRSRMTSVSEYIDPLALHTSNSTNGNAGNAFNTFNGTNTTASSRPAGPGLQDGTMPWPRNPRVLPPFPRTGSMMMSPASQRLQQPTEVSAYLLSSPQGPQALVFSPGHGYYTGSMPLISRVRPTPTSAGQSHAFGQLGNDPFAPAAAVGVPADPFAQAAQQQLVDGVNAQVAQAANGEAEDPLGVQPILGHFWLLFRILVFAYFLLGSNMGWQRPMILGGIGLAFWLVRMGIFGDGGWVRRWWDGVVGIQRQPQAAVGQQNAAAGQGGVGARANPANIAANARQAMPTPEQVAQRLLNEAGAQRQNWLRERMRPVERAVVLFLASLWPGIGEGYVQQQRRQQEEAEAEARRMAEEEEARKREAESGVQGTVGDAGKAGASAAESSD